MRAFSARRRDSSSMATGGRYLGIEVGVKCGRAQLISSLNAVLSRSHRR